MINEKTNYRFYEFWVPKKPKYRGSHGWNNILGDFINPIVYGCSNSSILFWFLQEGNWFQFCIAAEDEMLKRMEERIRFFCKTCGFKTKKIIRDKLGSALGGPRWMHKEGIATEMEANRSFLLADSLHKICKVYLDMLSYDSKKRQWEVLASMDRRQNYYGNIFESYLHLITNITGAHFPVEITVRTPWMRPAVAAKVACHL